MILIHDKSLRGHTQTGWLDSFHTFSFGGFNDPARIQFGNLRVINEDRVIPGAGFAPHRHENMDILTYVLSGKLRHEDDQGTVSEISAGEVQLMSAGRGLEHSEWNASETEPAHFLQIWLIPNTGGGAPAYDKATVPETGTVRIAGPERALLPLRSRTEVELVRLSEGERLDIGAADKLSFVHLIDGLADAEGERVSAGDGLQLGRGEGTSLHFATDGAALVFSMPSPKELLQ